MAKDQSQTDFTDLTRQAQALFRLNGAAMPQIEAVMKAQGGILKQVEAFNRHWIERRQQAVETALEAMNEMQSADRPDPAAAMNAISDWQRGSLERLTADLQEWMTLCMQATQLPLAAQNQTDQSRPKSSHTNENKATMAKA